MGLYGTVWPLHMGASLHALAMLANGYLLICIPDVKSQSALPDAKRDPEMGQLKSPWPTYGGSANYTMGLPGTVWPLHMAAGMPENGCSFREIVF